MATNPFINLSGSFSSSVDPVADSIPFWQGSTSTDFWISRNTFLNLASQPVGISDSQTLTNKTITSPTISGPTLSGTVGGTYTIGGTPTFPASVVTLSGTQTLTNKTLTSPTINGGTLSNATVDVDTVAGYTSSTTGTVYGMSVTSGVIASAALAGAVNTAALASASVTPSKLATGAASAYVATSQTTTSSSYTDLATAGPSVTVTIGANGLALVSISAYLSNSLASGNGALVSFVASGANTIAAGTQPYVLFYQTWTTNAIGEYASSWVLTGLSAGSTTFKMQYAISSGGTAAFANRSISVVPL